MATVDDPPDWLRESWREDRQQYLDDHRDDWLRARLDFELAERFAAAPAPAPMRKGGR